VGDGGGLFCFVPPSFLPRVTPAGLTRSPLFGSMAPNEPQPRAWIGSLAVTCLCSQQLLSLRPAKDRLVEANKALPATVVNSTDAAISLDLLFIAQTPFAVVARTSAVARGCYPVHQLTETPTPKSTYK